MKFDKRYKIWLAAADDESRPVLTHVLVEKDRIIAADGFILAVVPCVTDETDVLGLVSASALKRAAKGLKKSQDDVYVNLTESEVVVLEGGKGKVGVHYPRYASGVNVESQFPNWQKMLRRHPRHEELFRGQVTFGPRLLWNLARALGDEDNIRLVAYENGNKTYAGVWYAPGGPKNGKTFDVFGNLIPPFGLIMPTFVGDFKDPEIPNPPEDELHVTDVSHIDDLVGVSEVAA